jgi:hypothetical protein
MATLYCLFLPLTGAPWLLWIVDKESREPEEHFKDQYAGNAALMWIARIL